MYRSKTVVIPFTRKITTRFDPIRLNGKWKLYIQEISKILSLFCWTCLHYTSRSKERQRTRHGEFSKLRNIHIWEFYRSLECLMKDLTENLQDQLPIYPNRCSRNILWARHESLKEGVIYIFGQSVGSASIRIERDYLYLGARPSSKPEKTGKWSQGHFDVGSKPGMNRVNRDKLSKKGAEGSFCTELGEGDPQGRIGVYVKSPPRVQIFQVDIR